LQHSHGDQRPLGNFNLEHPGRKRISLRNPRSDPRKKKASRRKIRAGGRCAPVRRVNHAQKKRGRERESK